MGVGPRLRHLSTEAARFRAHVESVCERRPFANEAGAVANELERLPSAFCRPFGAARLSPLRGSRTGLVKPGAACSLRSPSPLATFYCPFGAASGTQSSASNSPASHTPASNSPASHTRFGTHDPRWSETIRLGCFLRPFGRVWNTKLRFELARFEHTCFETRPLE